VTIASGGSPLHPQLACDAGGSMYLSWLQDGSSPWIAYAKRDPSGTWGATETVASGDVLDDSNSDQGPSLIVTSSGVPTMLYVSGVKTWNGANYGAVRVKQRTGSGWVFDNPSSDVYVHTPQIYGQGNDVYVFLGHDINVHYGYLYQLSGSPWTSENVLYSGDSVDGSATIRWDPARETNASVIDTGFFDEDIRDNKSYLARVYYMAVLPHGAQPGSGGS
jgi:hypothetical protein